MGRLTFLHIKDTTIFPIVSLLIWYNFSEILSLICNCAIICKQSNKALIGISTQLYSDMNFIEVK